MHALLLALALGQATPAAPSEAEPPPQPAATAPRPVELLRLPGGGFQVTLDGNPVAGADLYRAVLRPDLAARVEQAGSDRTALLVAAAAAPLVGLGVGWSVGASQRWPLPPCYASLGGPVDCGAHDQVAAQNRSAMRSALLVGAGVGLSAGVLLAVIGRSVHAPEPTAEEAEALVRAYRARTGPVPDPAPLGGRPGAGASLDLQAGPGTARLALRVRF
jgi:hypothetical protein